VASRRPPDARGPRARPAHLGPDDQQRAWRIRRRLGRAALPGALKPPPTRVGASAEAMPASA